MLIKTGWKNSAGSNHDTWNMFFNSPLHYFQLKVREPTKKTPNKTQNNEFTSSTWTLQGITNKHENLFVVTKLLLRVDGQWILTLILRELRKPGLSQGTSHYVLQLRLSTKCVRLISVFSTKFGHWKITVSFGVGYIYSTGSSLLSIGFNP